MRSAPDAPAPRSGTGAQPGRIALIRHGETSWSASGRHTSVTDVDLTPRGERDARSIPALLRGLRCRPVTVLVSPRRRALRTAELAGLGTADGLAGGRDPGAASLAVTTTAVTATVTVTDELAEWDYGRYEGLTTPQIRAAHPGWDLFADGCPGGESPEQVGRRADRLLDRVRRLAERGDVALVCHGHISRTLAVRWVGLPVAAAAVLAMDAAAVTVLGTYHGGAIIEHANVVPFAR